MFFLYKHRIYYSTNNVNKYEKAYMRKLVIILQRGHWSLYVFFSSYSVAQLLYNQSLHDKTSVQIAKVLEAKPRRFSIVFLAFLSCGRF